jgi:hypothetical protein
MGWGNERGVEVRDGGCLHRTTWNRTDPTRQMDAKIRTKTSLSDSGVPDVLDWKTMLWVHSGRRRCGNADDTGWGLDGADARLLLSYFVDNTTPMRCERDQRGSIGCCGKAGSCSLGGWKMLAQKMLYSSRALINIKESDHVHS